MCRKASAPARSSRPSDKGGRRHAGPRSRYRFSMFQNTITGEASTPVTAVRRA
jgi:hypothetical protein